MEENPQGMISILDALIPVRWSFPEAGKVGDRDGRDGNVRIMDNTSIP
jgi:hypothetical protein